MIKKTFFFQIAYKEFYLPPNNKLFLNANSDIHIIDTTCSLDLDKENDMRISAKCNQKIKSFFL